MKYVKTFPNGHWSNGIFVLDEKENQTHFSRIFGSIIWPKPDQPGVVMAMGEHYKRRDDATDVRTLELLADDYSEDFDKFFVLITDLARIFIIDRFFTRAADIEQYIEFYRDQFRRDKLRSPNLHEAPYEERLVLGYQLTTAKLKKLQLMVPRSFAVHESLEQRLDIKKLDQIIDKFPHLEALYFLVMAFAKFPWQGHAVRQKPERYLKPLDKVAGY